ncbi:hypothetical protein D3C76_1083940 [compost metagenome]
MAFITELDIVNACLKSMGRTPINSLAGGSPIIASAKECIETALMEEQGIGWWFNTEFLELDADTDGYVNIPADTLALDVEANPPWMTTRGSRIYDNRIGDYYKTTGKTKVVLTRLVPLDDLPYQAQRLVQTAAVLSFQDAYDADDAKIKTAQAAYDKSYTIIRAQHIRAVGANVLNQGAGAMSQQRTRRFYGRDERFST